MDCRAASLFEKLEKPCFSSYPYAAMPEFVSAVGFCAGFAALQMLARSTSAVSPEAEAVQKAASTVVDCAERSQALFGARAAAISKVRALADECNTKGWDGEGAEPIRFEAAVEAVELIRSLPQQFPLPDFAPEPDGSISLDWIQSRTRVFSISVAGRGRLACAWIDGTDRGHAVAGFQYGTLPRLVREGIAAMNQPSHALLRAA